MSAPVAHVAQSVLVETAFRHLTLPDVEQVAEESGVEPWALALELVGAAERCRSAPHN